MAKCTNCKFKTTTCFYNEIKDFCEVLGSVIVDIEKEQECEKFQDKLILKEI